MKAIKADLVQCPKCKWESAAIVVEEGDVLILEHRCRCGYEIKDEEFARSVVIQEFDKHNS